MQLNIEPKRSKPVKLPSDWGLNYDRDYLRFRFEIWLRSGFRVWPREGGMDDQDQALVDDFEMLLQEHNYQWANRHEWLEKK